MKSIMKPYRLFLLVFLVITWIWAAIEPRYPQDWLLENLLVFIFVPAILIGVHVYGLSNISCTLITLFMSMHLIGSHYTYSEVPLGFVLQDWFESSRNMYDRLVHFSFGLLLAYPLREILLQVTKTKGIWSYWLPFVWVLSFSAVYEIIEWLVAERVDPTAGLAFLGAQGDIWDSQKDMVLALLGSVLALGATAIFNRVRPSGGSNLATRQALD